MQKTLFEWVVIMSKGEDIILSENQYSVYKENWKDGKIFFKENEINPAFVVQSFRRPAEELKKRYPCNTCFTTGVVDSKPCDKCDGTGVILPK